MWRERMWDEGRLPEVDTPFTLLIIVLGLMMFIQYRKSVTGWLGGIAFGLIALRWLLLKPSEWIDDHEDLFGGPEMFFRLQFWAGSIHEAARWCLLGSFIALAARWRDEPRSPGGPISKAFHLGWIYGPLAVAVLLTLLMPKAEKGSRGEEAGPMLIGAMVLMVIALILGTVFLCVLVYRMWSVIQDGRVRTTPGMAVGLLFVPLFNFYWIFQVYWGWTNDFNRYAEERGIQAPRMPEGLAIATCVLTICGLIPFFQPMLALIGGVFQLMVLSAACDGMNAVAHARAAAMVAPSESPPAPPDVEGSPA